jgi:hypothetical protein
MSSRPFDGQAPRSGRGAAAPYLGGVVKGLNDMATFAGDDPGLRWYTGARSILDHPDWVGPNAGAAA